jgi:hypothetical protein
VHQNKNVVIAVGLATGVLVWLGVRSIAQGATAASGSDDPLEPYSGDPAADANGHRTPSGPRVVKKQIPPYPGDRCTSVRSILATVQQAGLSGRAAVLFTAHISRETGYGNSVKNNCWPNVKAPATGSPWFRHSDEPYTAFPTSLAGMRRALEILDLSRYASAKRKLLAGDKTWYSDLGIGGYYEYMDPVTHRYVAHTAQTVALPGEGQDDYNKFLAKVEACLV